LILSDQGQIYGSPTRLQPYSYTYKFFFCCGYEGENNKTTREMGEKTIKKQ